MISTTPSTSREERLGPVAAETADTREDEALPAGRNDGRRHVRDTKIGDRPHVRDFGISTVSDTRVHHPTTIVAGKVVGQYLRHRVPVAGREVRPRSARVTRLAAFSSRGAGRLSSSKLRERGVDVCLVEQFDAVDQVAIDGGKDDLSPFGFEAVLRGPADRLSEDCSKVAQPMHSLDVGDDVRCEVPRGTHVCGQVTGREPSRSPVIDVHKVRHELGHFVPVGCGKGLRHNRPRMRVGGGFAGG